MTTNIKNQTFGMELEFTGITREKAAMAISQEITGERYNFTREPGYDRRVIRDERGRKWTICSDSSVSRTERGGEFVTPICTYEDIEIDGIIQRCVRALKRAGAKVDNSCGLHVHVGADKHTAKSLKNLVFTFKAKQDLIYKAVEAEDRKRNRYCKPIGENLIENLKKVKKINDENIKDTWYETYAPYQNREQHYNMSRYHGLNLHSVWYRGTVEFRLFHATLHAGKVRAYINLCLAMSAQAINSSRASAEVLDNGNEKYAMRCWLLRLGFIGDEWKTVREHLTKNLSGNAAWKNDPNSYDSYRRQRAS